MIRAGARAALRRHESNTCASGRAGRPEGITEEWIDRIAPRRDHHPMRARSFEHRVVEEAETGSPGSDPWRPCIVGGTERTVWGES